MSVARTDAVLPLLPNASGSVADVDGADGGGLEGLGGRGGGAMETRFFPRSALYAVSSCWTIDERGKNRVDRGCGKGVGCGGQVLNGDVTVWLPRTTLSAAPQREMSRILLYVLRYRHDRELRNGGDQRSITICFDGGGKRMKGETAKLAWKDRRLGTSYDFRTVERAELAVIMRSWEITTAQRS